MSYYSSESSDYPPGVEVYDELPSDAIPQEVYAQAYGNCRTGCAPDYYSNCPPKQKYNRKVRCYSRIEFNININPVTNLLSNSGLEGTTRAWFRRKNGVVAMQIEGFQAQISGNGVTSVAVGMSVGNMSVTAVTTPIKIILRNSAVIGTFEVNPDQAIKYSIHFSLDDSVSASTGDTLQVPGFIVSWISEC